MYEEFKARMARQGSYMGQAFKNQSDMIMDATFSRDPAYRICYLQEKDAIFPEQTLNGYKQAKAVYAGREVYDMDDIRGFERIEAKFLVHTGAFLQMMRRTIIYSLDRWRTVRIKTFESEPTCLSRMILEFMNSGLSLQMIVGRNSHNFMYCSVTFLQSGILMNRMPLGMKVCV